MAYTPLTKDQFNKAQAAGFKPDQILQMEKMRKQKEGGMTPQASQKGISDTFSDPSMGIDVGLGFLKGAGRTLTGIAKSALDSKGGISSVINPMGAASGALYESTPIGSGLKKASDFVGGVEKKLAPTNLAQKLGGYAETAVESAIPLGGSEKTYAGSVAALEKTAASKTEQMVNQIIQGSKSISTPEAQKVLSGIDKEAVKNVKTYEDLTGVLETASKEKTKAVDQILAKDPNVYRDEDLAISTKVGDKTVSTNFVDTAIKHLQEFYTKTMNPVETEKISQLEQKMKTQGLSQTEINGLARQYGSTLTDNFFNKNGDLLKGTNAQASEAVRKGLKETSRSLAETMSPGDKALLKHLDESNSKIISMKDVAEQLSQKVRVAAAKQPIQGPVRGAVQAIGKGIGTAIDVLDGGFIRSLVKKSIGIGDSSLSIIEIEKGLQNVLKRLAK